MRRILVVGFTIALLALGCAKKSYVNEQIAAAESRTNSRLQEVSSKTDANAMDIQKLQALADELNKKTDKALNQVAGFEKYQVIWQGEVNFGFDKASLDGTAQSILDEAGQKMMGAPNSLAEIAGYTDRVGSRDYNYLLGQRRADAVRRYITDKYTIPLFRSFVVSFGKDKAAGMADQPHAGSKDRKVTVTVWAPPGAADMAPAATSQTGQ